MASIPSWPAGVLALKPRPNLLLQQEQGCSLPPNWGSAPSEAGEHTVMPAITHHTKT